MYPDNTHPKGTVIDHPKAYALVLRGVAEPADDECKAKADPTPEQMERAQFYYDRTEAGIIPDDFQAYADGLMVGYNPDGTWKPGPNFEEAEWQQRKEDSPIIIVEDE
jgi:hypothetical protein